jgi:hypothetical protein
MDQKYKRVISLGNNCEVAGGIMLSGIRDASYVFDWMETSIEFIYLCFRHGFEAFKFTSAENYTAKEGRDSAFYDKSGTGCFYHEGKFSGLGKVLEAKRAKYQRRVQRFEEVCKEGDVLFVRKTNTDETSYLEKIVAILRKRYTKKFKILLLVEKKILREGPIGKHIVVQNISKFKQYYKGVKKILDKVDCPRTETNIEYSRKFINKIRKEV